MLNTHCGNPPVGVVRRVLGIEVLDATGDALPALERHGQLACRRPHILDQLEQDGQALRDTAYQALSGFFVESPPDFDPDRFVYRLESRAE